MKRIVILVVLAFSFLKMPIAVAGEPSTYHMQGLRLVRNSDSILIKHGLCADGNDCTKKQLVLFKNMSSGIALSIYGISDVGVISEIIGASLDEYRRNANRMSIDVKAYREKHESVMGLIKPLMVNPYVKFYVQGEQ